MVALAPRPCPGTCRIRTAGPWALGALVGVWIGLTGEPAWAATQVPDPIAQGLPTAVARTRAALLELASRGAYEELARLARTSGKAFVYHQGFEQRKPAAYWRQQAARGEAPLAKLAILLRLRPVQSNGVWIWPAAAVNPDESAWAGLRPLYPAPRIQRFQAEGYNGWRTGIDAQGRWTMFLKGS